MRAMFIEAYGGPEQLVLKDLPVPVPAPDEVLIRVQALGINRAETYFRRGVWGDVVRVSGIECVGLVEHDPSGRLPKGRTVAAIMGGLGRTRNGSYAEFTAAPAANVIPLQTSLSWPELAAIPESYATAWSCVVDHLRIERGQTVLVRGATSALGQAAINVAHQLGARVVATTRRPEREPLLRSMGADSVLLEGADLSARVRRADASGIDGVLDLVGNTTFQDSLRMVRRHGTVCIAGFLGGSNPVPVDVLTGLAPGASLTFFASFMFGAPEYPVGAVPMQQIVERAERGEYRAAPARVFRFEDLPEAHRLMESNEAAGKLVAVVDY
jgi:NADPH2:quinone reductase